MFTIIGGDGKEYGPVTAAQVRSWLAAGRANLDTKAKAAGSDEWRTLADFPEFTTFGTSPPVMGSAVSEPVHSDTVLADRGMRLVARLIDWILELACSLPGLMILGPEFMRIATAAFQGQQPDLAQLDVSRLALGGTVLLVGWLVLLAIQIWLLTTRGQSVGKLVARVRVVRLDDSKAGFVHAWLMREALITFIGVVLGMMPFIGPVLLRPAFHLTDWCFIFRDDQRCLHDLIAGTKVIKVERPSLA